MVSSLAVVSSENNRKLPTAPPRKPEEEVNLKNFQITKLIGTGSFARVYLVKKLGGEDDGRFYAMKVVNKPTDSSQSLIRDHTIAEREVKTRATKT